VSFVSGFSWRTTLFVLFGRGGHRICAAAADVEPSIFFYNPMKIRKGSSSEKATRKPYDRWTTCHGEVRIHCPRTNLGVCIHSRRPHRCLLCLAAICPGCSMKGKHDLRCSRHKAQIGECETCGALRSALEPDGIPVPKQQRGAMDAADYLCDENSHFDMVVKFCSECATARGGKHPLHWRRMCKSHLKEVKKCNKCRSI
jgi:hypothetical protein